MSASSGPEISIWSTLLPVIVGGLIAISGGFFGPWFIESRKENSEKKKRRAEKFEQLVAALFEYEHWLDVIRDMQLVANQDNIVPTMPPSPFAKLHALSAIYFPEVEEQIIALQRAGKDFEVWIFEARQKRVSGDKNYYDGYVDAYKPYAKASKEALGALRSYAKREFN